MIQLPEPREAVMRIRDYIYAGVMALFFAGLLMSMAGYRPPALGGDGTGAIERMSKQKP